MIRTTIRLDDQLFKEARKRAIDQRIAFTDLIHQALISYLYQQKDDSDNKSGILKYAGDLKKLDDGKPLTEIRKEAQSLAAAEWVNKKR